MCKYLFSSGQSTEIEFSRAIFYTIHRLCGIYLHFQHIPIYIQKFLKAGTNTLKPKISPSIQLGFAPQGFSSYKTLPAYTDSSPHKIQGTKNILFFSLACTDI